MVKSTESNLVSAGGWNVNLIDSSPIFSGKMVVNGNGAEIMIHILTSHDIQK